MASTPSSAAVQSVRGSISPMQKKPSRGVRVTARYEIPRLASSETTAVRRQSRPRLLRVSFSSRREDWPPGQHRANYLPFEHVTSPHDLFDKRLPGWLKIPVYVRHNFNTAGSRWFQFQANRHLNPELRSMKLHRLHESKRHVGILVRSSTRLWCHLSVMPPAPAGSFSAPPAMPGTSERPTEGTGGSVFPTDAPARPA